jgi:hypothetical protein
MGDEGEQREYKITKVGEDGNPVEDKSSKDYTGKAQVQYTNGDTYDGDFKDGVREGYGVYTYGETGNKYEGEWRQNKKNGIGKMTFGTEGEYYGHFEDGKRNGEGVYKYLKTKDLYSGSWKNGLKHGKGTFIFFNTKMKIVGDWANGQITNGRWIFANGTYFEGLFENNYPKGEGLWHFANGNVVHGEFTHEVKDVEGKEDIFINWDSNTADVKESIFIDY